MAELVDMNGRSLLRSTYSVAKGQQTLQLNMSSLRTGSYILKITQDGKQTTQLIQKF